MSTLLNNPYIVKWSTKGGGGLKILKKSLVIFEDRLPIKVWEIKKIEITYLPVNTKYTIIENLCSRHFSINYVLTFNFANVKFFIIRLKSFFTNSKIDRQNSIREFFMLWLFLIWFSESQMSKCSYSFYSSKLIISMH